MLGARRILAALGLAASGLLLTGCHVEGTVDLVSTERADLDVIVSEVGLDCATALGETLLMEPAPDVDGVTACRVTGFLDLSDRLGLQRFSVVESGEMWVLDLALEGEWISTADGAVTIRFPGEVVSANQGSVSGNQVTIARISDLRTAFTVVARNRPGPSPTLLAGLAGAAAGVGATVLVAAGVWALRRRPDGRVTAPAVDGAPAPDADAASAGPDVRVEADWPDPEGSGRVAPPDHSWFSRPPDAGPPAPASAPPAPDPPADHSAWAPPDR